FLSRYYSVYLACIALSRFYNFLSWSPTLQSERNPMLKSEKNPVTTGQLPDRRACPRVPIRSVAYIELDDDNAGLIRNVSEGGIGLQSAEMITGERFERMILRLPKLERWI